MCLCGLFFTRGFISKDIFLDFFSTKKILRVFCFGFVIRLFLTFFYSFRLFICVFKFSTFADTVLFLKKSFIIFIRNIVPVIFSIIYCYWIINNYFYFFRALSIEKGALILRFLVFFIALLI